MKQNRKKKKRIIDVKYCVKKEFEVELRFRRKGSYD